ncbi:MAG: LysR family transcriptional regulator, partial [Acidobacteriota bacterium]
MDLRLLEIFCCVYESMSFSRAAERLNITQPTVSAHIKALEDYFGTSF